jgi:hypothetical protein
MSIKLPLVLSGGLIEQLQSGDSLSASPELRTFTNNNAGSIVIGTPVYMTAADHVDKAKADATGTCDVIGLVYDTSISTTASGAIQVDGIFVATTTQWDAVAGTSGGLTFNTIYYLDPATPGMLTATPPSASGQFSVMVGRALSTTELELTLPGQVVAL